MISAQAKLDCGRLLGRLLEPLRYTNRKLFGQLMITSKVLEDWFAGAGPGDRFNYLLSEAPLSEVRKKDPVIEFQAAVCRGLFDLGYVSLLQSRWPNGKTVYMMQRSSKGLIPPQAMHSIAGSTHSAVYNGDEPGLNKDGGFSPPGRKERKDGAPRPTLEQLDAKT